MKLPIFAALVLMPIAATGLIAGAGDELVNDMVQRAESLPSIREVAAMASRFAPADTRADLSAPPEGARRERDAEGEPLRAGRHPCRPVRAARERAPRSGEARRRGETDG